MAAKKKKTSPGRVRRGNRGTPCNAVRPIDFDADKNDNLSFTIHPTFHGNAILTCAFQPSTIEAKTFQSGTNSPKLHTTIKQALVNACLDTLRPVIGNDDGEIEVPVMEAIAAIVEQRYLPNCTGDPRFISWSVRGNDGQIFDPIAMTKYLSTRNKPDMVVYAHMPDDVAGHFYLAASSILDDVR